MISLTGISKQYGGEYLFRDVSLRIGDDERLSIVGSNGAGKSTLMKILAGQVEPDSGSIAASRTNTVGYLPQDGVHHSGRTLFDEASQAFDDILGLHTRLEELGAEIASVSEREGGESPALLPLIEELGEIQHVLEHREGYNIETRVAQVLGGLGFAERDFGRMTEEFSGGWQMRIEIAKLLLREPTILLMDEPTNHLDLESLEWVEDYMRSYKGSVVLVSHDRRFLDNVVHRTLEVSMGRITEYSGNFSFYLAERDQRKEHLVSAWENQQQMIKQTMQFVDRFRYKATKSRQVQSRLKMLDKIERIELEDEEDSISFSFPPPPPSGRILMSVESLSKSYGTVEVLKHATLHIEKGDRIAFLGANGTGKSTLARIMAGIEPFQDGECRAGHNAVISYYAQNQAEELDGSKTVLQTIDDIAVGEIRKHIRSLLGCFLFSGDDVLKRVSVLSGGEKSRLALAKMLLTPANLLILDEPTNHLDMRSKSVLQQALLRFSGSYIIVSHDRDFLEPIVNKVVDIHDKAPRITLGTMSDYLRKRHGESEPTPPPRVVEKTASVTGEDRNRKRAEAERRQEKYKNIKPLKNELQRIEQAIAADEKRKAELEQALCDPELYRMEDRIKILNAEYASLKEGLEARYFAWAELQEKIESMGG